MPYAMNLPFEVFLIVALDVALSILMLHTAPAVGIFFAAHNVLLLSM